MSNRISTPDFVARFNAAFGERLNNRQIASIEFLLHEIEQHNVTDNKQIAYILATVWHECGFLSIRERRARPTNPEQTKIWRWQNRYWSSGFYGRGFSQLTWRFNYARFSPIVGIDLVRNPDAALQPGIGAKIIVFGMVNGSFTAPRHLIKSPNRLSKYFPPDGKTADFIGAREIVNGTFRADVVAHHAVKIWEILVLMSPAA
jgi:putative chitinase